MHWKYKVISLGDRVQANSQKLNEAGSLGLELVTVHTSESKSVAYLKKMEIGNDREIVARI